MSQSGNSGAALMLARIAGGVIADRLGIGRTCDSTTRIPARAEDISPHWLTEALCASVLGAHVVDSEVLGGSDGTSSRRAISVRYNRIGVDAGLPTRVFAKAAVSLSSRALLGLTGVTRGEAIFFNELRPHVKLRSPTGYFAAADPSNGRSIVLMEDLAVQGWTSPDPMQDRIGERDAIDMTEQMATYHAAFWDGRQAGTAFKQLPTPLQFQNNVNRLPGFVRQFHRGLRRSRELLPAALWAQRDRLWPAFMRSLEISSAGTPTLLHQDLHQGNWLRDPDGRMGLYDWQCVARGSCALDMSYALIATLDTESRLSWQHDLVRTYLDELAKHGVTDAPTFDEAWLDVRRQTLHALCLWNLHKWSTAVRPRTATA
ncbi:phosphotransferase [Mycobacterium sp.]|uniref:phosphotransferase n=1 Tax=Mycobacterium sp. TaxID=1785 RepID=UPI00333FDB4E